MDYLSNVIEWEPGEEDVSKELGHTEDAVHYPVGEPLSIILFGGTFNGFDPGERVKNIKTKSSNVKSNNTL